MIIYLVYQKDYEDTEIGKPEYMCIYEAYKSKKKAVRKAKSLVNQMKAKNLYIDDDIRNVKNPFKRNNWVDFYKEGTNQSNVVSSIILEETKLIA